MIRLYDSMVHRWETHQLFPPSSPNFQFLPTSANEGRGEREVTHYSSWNFAPTSVSNGERSGDERVRTWKKRRRTNVGWIAFNDNTSLLFQFLSNPLRPSLSFREERNTAERNLIEENKSESRAQNSFCPRFASCQPASQPVQDWTPEIITSESTISRRSRRLGY